MSLLTRGRDCNYPAELVLTLPMLASGDSFAVCSGSAHVAQHDTCRVLSGRIRKLGKLGLSCQLVMAFLISLASKDSRAKGFGTDKSGLACQACVTSWRA